VRTKISLGLIFIIVLIGVISFVSSTYTGGAIGGPKTLITGTVYYESMDNPVSGADVLIKCKHHGMINRKKAKTLEDGTYYTVFLQEECDKNDLVLVRASKEGVTGENNGLVEDTELKILDIAIVNVPLVPEFGVVAGIASILGAVGIFFFVRRHK
jgi:hypothetical protein